MDIKRFLFFSSAAQCVFTIHVKSDHARPGVENPSRCLSGLITLLFFERRWNQ